VDTRADPALEADNDSLPGPFGFRSFVTEATRLYRSNVGVLAPSFLVVALPLWVLPVAGIVVLESAGGSRFIAFMIFFVQLAALQLFGSLLVGPAAVVMTERLHERPMSVKEALRELRPLRSSLIATGLYSVIAAVLLLVVPVIPATVVLGPPIFAHVIALERKTLQEALPRARSLLKRNALRLFTYLFVVLLLAFILDFVLYSQASVVERALGVDSESVLALAGALLRGLVTGVVLWPVASCLSLVAYFDVRARAAG